MSSLAATDARFLGVPVAPVRRFLDEDGEWRRAARFWNTRIRFYTEDEELFMRVLDGQVSSLQPGSDGYQASNIQIGGPAATWREMIEPAPKPLFQDFFPAMMHHGIVLGGDLVGLYAYYGALSRVLVAMRACRQAA